MKKFIYLLSIFSLLAKSLFADMNDDPLRATLLMDRLEVQDIKDSIVTWDISAYIGKDIDKLYLYSEGSKSSEESEVQNELVVSRAITPFWDLQGGIEHDKAESDSKVWGVIALQGLAPYFIDTRLKVKIGEDSVGVNFDFEYEALITQKLILTPRFEMEAYSNNVPEIGMGSGLSSLSFGLRLRYEFIREFAPYIGVNYSNSFGETKEVYGGKDSLNFIIGARIWYY
ncbi:copper resistance protein B [Hydrogenimonas thermophila]|uniref:Copper resistance protein B n=1 Tax=Hydrogenimonas thermophila TaxID=223786 RepID=A0A1I5S9Q8_9BACT|nr:copper resistance protein B [Hydrogenimonas thermophila]SFP67484.1 copper resistance protein B [Hydrogenimonas thermophila]